MRRLLTAIVVLFTVFPATAGPAAEPPQLNWLWPGEAVYFADDVPVNVVFVGYEEGPAPWQIDLAWFDAILPPYTVPVLRNTVWDAEPTTELLPQQELHRHVICTEPLEPAAEPLSEGMVGSLFPDLLPDTRPLPGPSHVPCPCFPCPRPIGFATTFDDEPGAFPRRLHRLQFIRQVL